MSLLEINGLCKRYPTFFLDEISMKIDGGCVTGLIGRNGAGKTTLIKSMLNLVHPTSGSVRIFGMELSEHETEIKQRIGYARAA